MVFLEAEHMCMTMRGIKTGSKDGYRGNPWNFFAEKEAMQNRFFQLLGRQNG